MANPESCRYMKSHEWVCFEGDLAVVGVSDHAQKEITDVVFVEPPKAGRKVRQGEAVAVVESVKAAFDIYAPVSGEVAEANAELAADPALINSSPHDKGWIFKLKGARPDEARSLMDFAGYGEFLKASAH